MARYAHIDCNFYANYCRWKTNCNTIPSADVPLQIMVHDNETQYELTIEHDDMLVDGENFGFT